MNSFGSFTIGAVLGAAALFGLAYLTEHDSKAFKERFKKNQEDPDVDNMNSTVQSKKEDSNYGNVNKETPSSDPVENV